MASASQDIEKTKRHVPNNKTVRLSMRQNELDSLPDAIFGNLDFGRISIFRSKQELIQKVNEELLNTTTPNGIITGWYLKKSSIKTRAEEWQVDYIKLYNIWAITPEEELVVSYMRLHDFTDIGEDDIIKHLLFETKHSIEYCGQVSIDEGLKKALEIQGLWTNKLQSVYKAIMA